MPPRVLASGPKPCGSNKPSNKVYIFNKCNEILITRFMSLITSYSFFFSENIS